MGQAIPNAQVAASDLPVIGQVANGVNFLQSEIGSAISTFKNIYSAYEDAFCTPAYYTPPTNVPANLTGVNTLASCSAVALFQRSTITQAL